MSESYSVITSSQNQYVSLARGLLNKKEREKRSLFRFDGVKLACEAVKKGVDFSFALICEGQENSVFEKTERLYGISRNDLACCCYTVASHIFERLTEENAPEGIICVARYIDKLHTHREGGEIETVDDKILILDAVRDPQNVGAIVRSAAAFGVDRILMSDDCADIYNSKAVRASMGALFGMRIDMVRELGEDIKALRAHGRRVFAATLNDSSVCLGDFEVRQGDCVVIGNEGHGIDEKTVSVCTDSVYIPMADGVESLNAATAATVLVWEFFGSGRGMKEEI